MEESIQEWTKKNLEKQVISLQIFKGCLPQILLGPFMNTLSQNVLALSLIHDRGPYHIEICPLCMIETSFVKDLIVGLQNYFNL